jgi:hypothetical protein
VLGRLDATLPIKWGVRRSDILGSSVRLLVQGKSDFHTIGNFRGDTCFNQTLGIGLLPPIPAMGSWTDARAAEMFDFAAQTVETPLNERRANYADLPCGGLPPDVNIFANQGRRGPSSFCGRGGTAREGVASTHADVGGYCPLAGHLGSHGFCLGLALRPGVQHSASEIFFKRARVIPMTQRLSAAKSNARILAQRDSGFDSVRVVSSIEMRNQAALAPVGFLINWNPLSIKVAALPARLDADPATPWEHPRAGKRVGNWERWAVVEGAQRPVRRVLHLVACSIHKHGQALIVPELTIKGWTRNLRISLCAQNITPLHADHSPIDQFRPEFKTNLDLPRLPGATQEAPSTVGKVDSNDLVCQLTALAMNILGWMGRRDLLGPEAPVPHSAKRRRATKVMQALSLRTARMIEHAPRVCLGLGADERAASVFTRMGAQFAAPP